MRSIGRALVAVALVVGLLGCGGGDDDDPTATAAQACTDVKALGQVGAETVDDVREIAARDGVPDDLRAALLKLADLIGKDQAEATDAQAVLVETRDVCAKYGG